MTPKPADLAVLEDRVLAIFLGAALGDALGAPVEFLKTSEIIAKYAERAPDRLSFGGDVTITDDTQMLLFVAEGLIRARERARDRGISSVASVVVHALLRWYRTQTESFPPEQEEFLGWLIQSRGLWARRAPGKTNLSALRALRSTFQLQAENDSKGCGAIMRTAPFALLADEQEAFNESVESAAITHGHPSGSLSAGAFTVILHGLVRGTPFADAVTNAVNRVKKQKRSRETLDAIASGMALGAKGPPSSADLDKLGGGWTGESALAIALAVYGAHIASAESSFAAATWRAALHNGDSDSTATLVGQLIGAVEGTQALPPAWLEELELRDVIERIAKDTFQAMFTDLDMVFEDYPPN